MSDDFNNILQALVDVDRIFPPKYLHRLSDLEKSEQVLLTEKWAEISESRKISLLDDLIDLSDAETLVNFDEIGMIALKDQSINVRIKGLELLEYSEDHHLIPNLINIIKLDPEVKVKVAAVETAANFVYKGEVDEYPKEAYYRLTATLKGLIREENPGEIKQKALEALGYSGDREIKRLIEFALSQVDDSWKNSALIAMGRSLDPRWKKNILDELIQDNPATVISAIKAAGDMEIPSARRLIFKIINNHEDEDLIKKNSAWALARIGGPGVKNILEKFISLADGEADITFFEECLDEYTFRHDTSGQSMFNFKVENGKDVLDEEIEEELTDLEDEDDYMDDIPGLDL